MDSINKVSTSNKIMNDAASIRRESESAVADSKGDEVTHDCVIKQKDDGMQ